LSDFDAQNRVLRLTFIGPTSVLVVTYRLCPRCGVTMEERPGGWVCGLCSGVIGGDLADGTDSDVAP
jgi:ribosomal protein S27AE